MTGGGFNCAFFRSSGVLTGGNPTESNSDPGTRPRLESGESWGHFLPRAVRSDRSGIRKASGGSGGSGPRGESEPPGR